MTVNFPVTESILSPQAIEEEIIPGFGIGGFNHTYRLKTNSGSTYYLRAYRKPWRTLADIRYELDMLNHLKTKGFPAVQPLPYQNGEYYCAVPAPEGERYLALFTEVAGPEITYDHEPEKVALHYGQAVAQVHNALDDFSSPHPRFHLDIEHFIDQPLGTIASFLTHRPADWEYVQHFANTLRRNILAAPAASLEQGFCHGDLQGYHANLATDGTLTFFDFDCGGYGYRAYDLAVFLWCCRLEDAVAVRWESFLVGYRETRIVSDLDVQVVPLFVCARYLWHMGAHTRNAPQWGTQFINDVYFDNHLANLRSAEADYLRR